MNQRSQEELWDLICKVTNEITLYYDKAGPGPSVEDMTECLQANGGNDAMRRSILSHMLVRKIDPFSIGLDRGRMTWAMNDLYENMAQIQEEFKTETYH